MFIDQKGKLFGKISIIDLLVIIVVIVAVLGSVLAFAKVKSGAVLTENKSLISESALDTLEVRMRLKEVRSMTADSIHIGDEVYAKDTNKYLGKVSRIEIEPATRIITGFKGDVKEAEIPERMDVIMVLEVMGSRTDNGYFTGNNIHLVYDSSMEILTPTIQSTPEIEGIAVIENK